MPARKIPLSAAQEQRFRQARQDILQLDYFLKGTVLQRMMKCGRPQCACHSDPAKRHGPYFEWTYKVKGKTVNVKLSRHQTAPQTQDRSGEAGAPIENCARSSGEAGRQHRLTSGDVTWAVKQTVFPNPASQPHIPLAIRRLPARLPKSMRHPG